MNKICTFFKKNYLHYIKNCIGPTDKKTQISEISLYKKNSSFEINRDPCPSYISHYFLIKFQKTPTLTTTQICSCVILMTYYIHPMSQFVCNSVSHLIFQPSHSRSGHIQSNIVVPSKSHKSALGKGQRTRKALQFQNGFGFEDSGTYVPTNVFISES